jgi:hypothetical protein
MSTPKTDVARMREAIGVIEALKTRNAQLIANNAQLVDAHGQIAKRLTAARELVEQSRAAGLANVDVGDLARALGMTP